MKLIEILTSIERPTGWSKSSYYRLRSAASRVLKLNDGNVEINQDNMNEMLANLEIIINYKNGGIRPNNRTFKTYITEIRRYILYNNNILKYGNSETRHA